MGASLIAFAVAACRRGVAVQAPRGVSLSSGAREYRRNREQHCAAEKGPRKASWAERATHEWSVRLLARKNRWLERLKFFVTRVIGLGRKKMRREGFPDRLFGQFQFGFW